MVLEALWNLGELVIAGRVNGFERLYDLPDHVLQARCSTRRFPIGKRSCANSSDVPFSAAAR
jgi:uncharacterized protein YcaQ